MLRLRGARLRVRSAPLSGLILQRICKKVCFACANETRQRNVLRMLRSRSARIVDAGSQEMRILDACDGCYGAVSQSTCRCVQAASWLPLSARVANRRVLQGAKSPHAVVAQRDAHAEVGEVWEVRRGNTDACRTAIRLKGSAANGCKTAKSQARNTQSNMQIEIANAGHKREGVKTRRHRNAFFAANF